MNPSETKVWELHTSCPKCSGHGNYIEKDEEYPIWYLVCMTCGHRETKKDEYKVIDAIPIVTGDKKRTGRRTNWRIK
jgi:Zn ribbon nucleic-acid-binding protein